MRLPHFVKTSCGTPSRELFRFGLPAHRHRREGWLGRTRGDGGVPPFPFWEICDFPKWLQNINNVLRCKCETYLHNPCEYQIKNTPVGCFLFGWGARIRTMIKRTKISCPTIRRHPKSNTDYKYLLCFCNNNFT